MAGQALLVIDVQQGLFGANAFDGPGLIERINALAARLRARHVPVVFIRHCGAAGSGLHPDEPGHPLHRDLQVRAGDVQLAKHHCDAFLDTQLDAVLRSAGVSEVIVTGFATEFCVDSTVRSALARGYRTVVPEDGHTTGDREQLSAEQIIAHHNATWIWLETPMGGAQSTRCAGLV